MLPSWARSSRPVGVSRYPCACSTRRADRSSRKRWVSTLVDISGTLDASSRYVRGVSPISQTNRSAHRRPRTSNSSSPYCLDGKRQQITRTFDKLKEARAELSRIRHETDQGTYVKPSEITVNDYLDEYLVGATRGRRESTKVSYRDAFRPVRERLGARALQSLSLIHI